MPTPSKALTITLGSLFLGLVFNWFFYNTLLGISVFIYTALILGGTLFLAWKFRQPLNKTVYWLAPIALFFSLMVYVRANSFLTFINVVLIIYLLLLIARLAGHPTAKLRYFEVPQYLSLAGSMPMRIITEFFRQAKNVVSNRSVIQSKSAYVPIVRGLLLSLPVLFVFLLLFSSADAVFRQYTSSLFAFDVNPETVFRLGLVGFVASLFSGAYALIFMPTSLPSTHDAKSKSTFELGATEALIMLGSVSLLFFAFVAVQLTYLFGGAEQISTTGYTYAEYARKGFFELIAVAAIALLLIWAIKRVTNFSVQVRAKQFKWLSAILVVEVMLIMASAHMRLSLYEDAYGFTMLRLVSHVFILWLAVAFVLLLVNIIREMNENQFAYHLFASAICFFAIFNLINPDAFIARQNIDRFNDTGKLDFYYLRTLSDDAVPEVATLLDHPDETIQKSAASVLHQQKYAANDKPTPWQSANIGRYRSDKIFRDKSGQIEAGKEYIYKNAQ